jgi:hypothetical protein
MKLQLCMIAIGVAFAAVSEAKQLTLTPSASLRVVNPADPGDILTLYKFTLPDRIIGADIVRAFVTVTTTAVDEVPIAVTSLDREWSETDSWQVTSGRMDGASETPVYVGSNDASGFEIPLTSSVTSWAKGEPNFGICLGRYPTQRDDLARVLTDRMSLPELTVIYVER